MSLFLRLRKRIVFSRYFLKIWVCTQILLSLSNQSFGIFKTSKILTKSPASSKLSNNKWSRRLMATGLKRMLAQALWISPPRLNKKLILWEILWLLKHKQSILWMARKNRKNENEVEVENSIKDNQENDNE